MTWLYRQIIDFFRPPDTHSIRFRLTLGVVLASALAIGGVSGWLNWRLQQILLAGHQEAIAELAQRFKEDVALYEDMMTTEAAVQKVIEHRTLGNTVIWADTPSGEAFASSETLAMSPWQAPEIADFMQNLPADTHLGTVNAGDRTLVVCVEPLAIGGETIGTLYMLEDVTQNRRTYIMMLRNLVVISGTAVLLLAVLIAIYVRRSLQPLHALSNEVMEVTADSLTATRLELDKAPSEVKELAHALDHTLERLAQSWEQQRRLVGDVSHELRTPLTLVQGYLQSTLRRCQTLTEPQRDGLETAASETDRTIQILNDLLVLARASMGHLQISAEKLDLKRVLLEAVMMADPTGDRIEADIQVAPLWARADASALRQVLVNLMDNAINYSSSEAAVTVRLFQQGQQAVIQVCDQGRGIPLADQTEIFQPFYRVDMDRSRATGGTGLGLAIVQTLLTKMRGTISVQSAPSAGSTFTVKLPLCQGV
ncbi:MAG: ATP-binding protein [Cyanobacteria bacterium P01_D01_bin.71]